MLAKKIIGFITFVAGVIVIASLFDIWNLNTQLVKFTTGFVAGSCVYLGIVEMFE